MAAVLKLANVKMPMNRLTKSCGRSYPVKGAGTVTEVVAVSIGIKQAQETLRQHWPWVLTKPSSCSWRTKLKAMWSP